MTTHPGLPELRDWQLNKKLKYYAGSAHNHPRLKKGTLISGRYESFEIGSDWAIIITNATGESFILHKADMQIYIGD